MAWFARLKRRAAQLKSDTFALYLAARDPRTPWHARLLVAAVVAYALSPIDLIPDFVPVLGYLDDLILVPLGILLAIRLVPAVVLAECRERARQVLEGGKPVSRTAGTVVILIWIGLAALCLAWGYEVFLASHDSLSRCEARDRPPTPAGSFLPPRECEGPPALDLGR
ncbi:MAG TPA: YkvA family protein [Methylococcus sp.]|nr:YkvA family protein [Methylococcus sp.]